MLSSPLTQRSTKRNRHAQMYGASSYLISTLALCCDAGVMIGVSLVWTSAMSPLVHALPKTNAGVESPTTAPLVRSQDTQASKLCPPLVHLDAPETTPRAMLNEAYWRTRWASQFDLDAPLLNAVQVESHNQRLRDDESDQVRAQVDLIQPIDPEALAHSVSGRLTYLRDLFDRGIYIRRGGARLSPSERALLEPRPIPLHESSFRVALASVQILCAPLEGEIEKPTADRVIDRNSCTRIRPQAPLEIIGSWSDELWLIRTRLALGWLPKDAPLSPPIPAAYLKRYLDGPFGHAQSALTLLDSTTLPLPRGARVPLLPRRGAVSDLALVATAERFIEWRHRDALKPAPRTLTRGGFLARLFTHLNKRYGLGGMHDGIDCSRVNIDTLEPFGLSVPRYSGHQAHIGSWDIELKPDYDVATRERIIDAALKRGITLLYIPGHMMTYLGRDHLGTPRVFHAFSDYQRPCAQGGETVVDVKIVSVTDLKRGAGSHKKSYLERVTRVVVLSDRDLGEELKRLMHTLTAPTPQPQSP